MRTQEQVIADCEKRYQELRAEKERRDSDPKIQRPCLSCRWFSGEGDDGYSWSLYQERFGTCHEPLVKGFRKYGVRASVSPMPCGPEKALWQPKLTLCQRIINWLTED